MDVNNVKTKQPFCQHSCFVFGRYQFQISAREQGKQTEDFYGFPPIPPIYTASTQATTASFPKYSN
jgi:hypothetical protein